MSLLGAIGDLVVPLASQSRSASSQPLCCKETFQRFFHYLNPALKISPLIPQKHSGGYLLSTFYEKTRNYSFSIGELNIDKDSEKRSGVIAELFQ